MNAYGKIPGYRLIARWLKKDMAILFVLVFLLSSCLGETPATAPPTISVEETISILVQTARAATSTAQVSITPTLTSSSTPFPTPSDTPSPTPIPPSSTPVVINTVYRCQDSEFVKDVTIPDGTVLSPGQVFVKTWKFLNNGNCAWRSDFSIIFLRGNRMHGSDAEIDSTVKVNRRVVVSVTMVAPSQPGKYHAHWQLADQYGYTFGDAVTVDIVVANPTPTVTASPTLAIERGSLQILKTLNDPDGAPVPAGYLIYYNCGPGNIGQVSVAPGGSAVVTGIPVGSSCSVTEVPPAAIAGYTWGAITYAPPSVVISAKDQTYTITVSNGITRDRGSLQIIKTLHNSDAAKVPASFTVNYDCGAGYSGQLSVDPSSSVMISSIPVGSACIVTEIAPDPIPGFTWGTATYSPDSIVIGAKDQVVSITVGNSLTADRGSLQIIKTLNNPDGAPIPAGFTVNYDCGTDYTGAVSVAPGSPATVLGIPYGRTCTVSEVAPDPIAGYIWRTATYTPASVVISARDQTFVIIVDNSITADDDTKGNVPSPSQCFPFHANCRYQRGPVSNK